MKTKDEPNERETTAGESIAETLARPVTRRTLIKAALASAPLLLAGPTLLLPRKAAAAPTSALARRPSHI